MLLATACVSTPSRMQEPMRTIVYFQMMSQNFPVTVIACVEAKGVMKNQFNSVLEIDKATLAMKECVAEFEGTPEGKAFEQLLLEMMTQKPRTTHI